METFLKECLEAVRKAGLYRRFRIVHGPQGPSVQLEDPDTGERRDVLLLCSNNYLGLAADPRLRSAAAEASLELGTSAGASRHVSGTMALHERLEQRLARLTGCERAVVFNTGYVANLGTITSLVGPTDAVFSDELNHASIIDACRFSRADTHVFRHRDMKHLDQLLGASTAHNKLIVTDGLFSMAGDLAPLPDIVALARRYRAWTMVDEAHAIGCLGPGGGGAIEHFGLTGQVDVTMGTMGKALGSFGAFVAGSETLIEHLVNRSRMLMFTTALPPAVAAASLAALDIVENEPERRGALRGNAERLRAGFRHLGLSTLESEAHIVPVVIGDAGRTMTFARQLLEEGIFISGIRPPTVPQGTSRLRVAAMATHSAEQITEALQAFQIVHRNVEMGSTQR